MKEVERYEVYEMVNWGWECPECDFLNEEDDDPAYKIQVQCQACGKYFIQIAGS